MEKLCFGAPMALVGFPNIQSDAVEVEGITPKSWRTVGAIPESTFYCFAIASKLKFPLQHSVPFNIQIHS